MKYTTSIVTVLVVCLLLGSVVRASRRITKYKYKVVATYPHDSGAFTQGLECDPSSSGCSVLFESTGLRGESTVRRVDTATGKVITKHEMPKKLFGEGLTLFNGELYQLTWKERQIKRYDPKTLRMTSSASYTVADEGWGLTSNGKDQLIASSGTSSLVFFTVGDGGKNDLKQQIQRLLTVKKDGVKLSKLNELEFARGHIWANVWFSNSIYEIDPDTGDVIGEVDLGALHNIKMSGAAPGNVLNGIAYDASADEFLVTGKNWNAVHRIRLINPDNDEL